VRYIDQQLRHRSRLCKEVGRSNWTEFELCYAHRESPAVALIVLSSSDNKYVERVRKISSRYGLGIKMFTIGGTGSSSSSPKPRASGEKEFWITSSGKSHNSSCRYYGTTKSGRYSDNPSRDSCKVCGGG